MRLEAVCARHSNRQSRQEDQRGHALSQIFLTHSKNEDVFICKNYKMSFSIKSFLNLNKSEIRIDNIGNL